MSAAPAAITPARSTSRPQSPSSAPLRCRGRQARQSRRLLEERRRRRAGRPRASISKPTWPRSSLRSTRSEPASSGRRSITARCATSARPAPSSAPARSSTCWARCRTRPASSASCSASSPAIGWSRWPRSCAISAPSMHGWSMAATAWTKSPRPARPTSSSCAMVRSAASPSRRRISASRVRMPLR